MSVYTEMLEVRTQGKGTYELTDQVSGVVRKSEMRDGLVMVFIRHTSASLIIYENADSSARVDLHEFFERLVPEHAPYFTHIQEGSDDMPSHIRMVLTRTSETIPLVDGQLALGTWQGIFLFEHRHAPHQRELVVTVIGK